MHTNRSEIPVGTKGVLGCKMVQTLSREFYEARALQSGLTCTEGTSL